MLLLSGHRRRPDAHPAAGKRTRWQQSPFLLTANKPVQDEDKDESE
jgi:uncharacterized membrane protein affecting hemolysin expression